MDFNINVQTPKFCYTIDKFYFYLFTLYCIMYKLNSIRFDTHSVLIKYFINDRLVNN